MKKLVRHSRIQQVFNGERMSLQRQIGLSLVELMIAMTLGVVLMGGVIQVFLSSRVVFSTQQAVSRVQESGRLAMEFISEDVRMAGYMGCLDRSATPVVGITSPHAFWDRYQERIRGYSANGLPVGLNLAPMPVEGTDVIVVRSAKGNMHYLSEENSLNTLKVLAGSSNGITIAPNLAAVVSNCIGARIFKPSAVAAGTITHTGGWGGAGHSPSEKFAAGAEVIPVFTTIYYIAMNPFGRPSLYQKIGSADPAVEIIEGVEDMALLFGSDTNLDGVIDSYSDSAGVGNNGWDNVGAVRVELLIQSNEENVLEDVQPYIFRGAAVAGPEDKRLRQVFSSLIAIRGRVE